MKKRAIDLELSIAGDELEQHRIQLEQNLQHTDLSLHLSSAPDEYNGNDSSVEYPRHNSAPSPFSGFASLEEISRDHFDPEGHSEMHGWTIRDDGGISPYEGRTVSTAAHHASVLTLSAGLGGRGARREISLSGAEYDPDRPLQDMLAGMDGQLSILDGYQRLVSKNQSRPTVSFDPIVMESPVPTRFSHSGGAGGIASLAARLRSPLSSSETSESETDRKVHRPKLSDALQQGTFSPKRPRSTLPRLPSQGSHAEQGGSQRPQEFPRSNSRASRRSSRDRGNANASSHLLPSQLDRDISPIRNTSTKRRPVAPQPEVNVQPPTPSTAGSKFTRMAKGLAKDIQHEQSLWQSNGHEQDQAINHAPVTRDGASTSRSGKKSRQAPERHPFRNIANRADLSFDLPENQPARRPAKSPKNRVYLPDVTGLTSAVVSPMRANLERYSFRLSDEPKEMEARLVASLNALHSKLSHLESENGIARRRVRELELELDQCRRDVARERSRVLEREEVITQQQQDVERARIRHEEGRVRRNNDVRDTASRYQAVVEEKKALEALITTLRSHLTRLTSELSSQQRLLTELRTLRDADARTLAQKSQDVDRLRDDVERLAGEIEVLRGVIDEGLNERRMIREQTEREESQVQEEPSADQTAEVEDEDEDEENEEEEEEFGDQSLPEQTVVRAQSPIVRRATPVPIPSPTIASRPELNRGRSSPSIRTDRATLDSSHIPGASSTRRFVDEEELERISVELEERRSDRSGTSSSRSVSSQRTQVAPEVRTSITEEQELQIPRVKTSSKDKEVNTEVQPPHLPEIRQPSAPDATAPSQPRRASGSGLDSRPSAEKSDTGAMAKEQNDFRPRRSVSGPETPFPQIRGGRLERMFFSAPEHNAKTCTTCYRRRRPSFLAERSSYVPRLAKDHNTRPRRENDDQEEEGVDNEWREVKMNANQKGKRREDVPPDDDDDLATLFKADRLPPQTVLARVLRELEDDFTHYKSIYVELADQYRAMDAASNVAKRNVLAEHLKDVIDTLERKGDQIASLYDLLTFKDKPITTSIHRPA